MLLHVLDRIEYVSLFTLLRLRNMCPLVLRLIMTIYISLIMQVRFGPAMSRHFSNSNVVKQGGVLSPILFTIEIDNLIIQYFHIVPDLFPKAIY